MEDTQNWVQTLALLLPGLRHFRELTWFLRSSVFLIRNKDENSNYVKMLFWGWSKTTDIKCLDFMILVHLKVFWCLSLFLCTTMSLKAKQIFIVHLIFALSSQGKGQKHHPQDLPAGLLLHSFIPFKIQYSLLSKYGQKSKSRTMKINKNPTY